MEGMVATMDAGSPRRVQARVAALSLAAVLAILGGCRKTPDGTFVSPGKEFTCEIPSDWKFREARGYLLGVSSPDEVGKIHADIRISTKPEGQTQETLQDHMKWQRNNWSDTPEFRQEPLKTINFAGVTALVYSMTAWNATAAMIHHWPGGPPEPVLYKETRVYFDARGEHYLIEYRAPVAIYDKHHPAFERLLDTFRWIGGGGS